MLTRLLKMFGNFTQYETKVQASLGTLLCYCEYEQDDQVNKALHGFQDLLVKDQKLNVRRLHHSQPPFGDAEEGGKVVPDGA